MDEDVLWDKDILTITQLKAAIKRAKKHKVFSFVVEELSTEELMRLRKSVMDGGSGFCFGLKNLKERTWATTLAYLKPCPTLYQVELWGPAKIHQTLPKSYLNAN